MHNVLSIQSAVAYGHAGNSSATFPLQRAGVNVLPVYTVNFSNHTGYGSWRGPMIPAADVAEVITGIDERGVLSRVDAVLAGYLGAADVGHVVLDAAALVKSRNPEAIFLADPVMGDVGRGFYARPGIPEFFREYIVAAANIMTPNLFELQYLVGRQTQTLHDVVAAAHQLRTQGPDIVLVTSVVASDASDGLLRMLAVDGDSTWLVETPTLDCSFVGSGDLTSAMFLAHWLRTRNVGETLGATASVVYSILEQTAVSGEPELQLVAAQEQVVSPTNIFTARPLS